MNLINSILNIIYPYVEEKWQSMSCHKDAIAMYLVRSQPNSTLGNESKSGFSNPVDRFISYENGNKYILEDKRGMTLGELLENPSFKLKKFIVDHDDIILETFERESKYKSMKDVLKNNRHGVTSICKKYMSFKLIGGENLPTSLIPKEIDITKIKCSLPPLSCERILSLLDRDDSGEIKDNERLTKSKVDKVLSSESVSYNSLFIYFEALYPHIDEIKSEDEKYKNIVKIRGIHSKFNREVLKCKSKPLRKNYICQYLGVTLQPEDFDVSQKEFVINNIDKLDEYISRYLSQEYNRIKSLYPDGEKYFSDCNTDEDFGEFLEGDEYLYACIHAEESIRKHQNIQNTYNALLNKYPNAIKGYEKTHIHVDDNLCRTWGPSLTEIIELGEDRLKDLERKSKDIERDNEWINKQNEYASDVRDSYNKFLNGWGCYYYDISVEIPSYREIVEARDYRIWQFFYTSYCDDRTLDYTLDPNCWENSIENSQFISNRITYKDFVYEGFINYMKYLKENMGKVCVFFGNSGLESDYDVLNSEQFSYLRHKLSVENIDYFQRVNDIDVKENTCIVVMELITSNSNLIKQCNDILRLYKGRYPYMFYVSMRKGFDTIEMKEIIKEKEEKNKQEEQERQHRIKEEQNKLAKMKKAKSIITNYSDAFKKILPDINPKSFSLEEAKKIISYEDKLREYYNLEKRVKNAVSDWERLKNIPYYYFYHYYPTRYEDVSLESNRVREMIYNFKDGRCKTFKTIAKIMTSKLNSTFDSLDLPYLTLVCIPASTVEDNEDRYLRFSRDLCGKTGLRNGFDHITIKKEKTPSHLDGCDSSEYEYDAEFFKDAKVILFDDIVTRGRSMAQMKSALEKIGATVVCAMSIGRTYSDYNDDDRSPHPWSGVY